MQKKIILW